MHLTTIYSKNADFLLPYFTNAAKFELVVEAYAKLNTNLIIFNDLAD